MEERKQLVTDDLKRVISGSTHEDLTLTCTSLLDHLRPSLQFQRVKKRRDLTCVFRSCNSTHCALKFFFVCVCVDSAGVGGPGDGAAAEERGNRPPVQAQRQRAVHCWGLRQSTWLLLTGPNFSFLICLIPFFQGFLHGCND